MSYRNILVHLDNSPRSKTRLDVAVDLAKRSEASLTGLYLLDVPSPSLFVRDTSLFDLGLADEIIERAREHAMKHGSLVEQRFRAGLSAHDVVGDWHCVDAPPEDAVANFGCYADLLVVGQVDPDQPNPVVGANMPVTAILQSGRPVLVIPYVGAVETLGQNVLIGWKSGREAARAVNDALPLLKMAQTVTVLTIGSQRGFAGRDPGAMLVRHLARHGIAATSRHTISDDVSDGDILLNEASDRGSDLIVVGGYGHSRATEFILGGVTRTLLNQMTVPVLFSH